MDANVAVWIMLGALILSIILNIVQAIINGQSVPSPTVDKWIERFGTLAEQTPTPVDDEIAEFLPTLKKLGQAFGLVESDTGLPAPKPQPPTPPVVEPTPLENKTIVIQPGDNQFIEGNRLVYIPRGFHYEGDPTDASGKRWVHPNAHWGDWDGLRINLDDTAGKFTFVLDEAVFIPSGLEYVAWVVFDLDIRPKEGADAPTDHWLFWDLIVDGALMDSVALHPGDSRATFRFAGQGRAMTLGFRLRLNWANLSNQSTLTWTEAGFAHGVGQQAAA